MSMVAHLLQKQMIGKVWTEIAGEQQPGKTIKDKKAPAIGKEKLVTENPQNEMTRVQTHTHQQKTSQK